jgi:hypothetical protein
MWLAVAAGALAVILPLMKLDTQRLKKVKQIDPESEEEQRTKAQGDALGGLLIIAVVMAVIYFLRS